MANVTKDTEEWNKIQMDFYDSRDHKRMWHKSDSLYVRNILKRIIAFAEVKKGAKILEIGCGAGRFTIPLIRMGYKVTAVDLSRRMLDKLEDDLSHLGLEKDQYRIICGDFHSYDAESLGVFDAVIGFNVLHHLYDMTACFKSVSPFIEPGGQALFLEPNAFNPLHYLDSLLDGGWKAEGNKFNSIPSKVKASMEVNNFYDIEYSRVGFWPPFLIDWFPPFLKVEEAIEKIKCINKVLPFFFIKGQKPKHESGK